MIKKELFLDFDPNPPTIVADIAQFEKNVGFKLPQDYMEFLLWANGGVGSIGQNAYISLWRLEDLIDDNKGYNVAEFAPGFFIFGSNGGGEAHAFDIRTPAMPIVDLPFIGMEPSVALPIAPTFNDFLEVLSKKEW